MYTTPNKISENMGKHSLDKGFKVWDKFIKEFMQTQGASPF